MIKEATGKFLTHTVQMKQYKLFKATKYEKLVLNPHGSDETRQIHFPSILSIVVLNPHGSDETVSILFH